MSMLVLLGCVDGEHVDVLADTGCGIREPILARTGIRSSPRPKLRKR